LGRAWYGPNRIGSSRLYDLSRALDVPVDFFFEEMPVAVAASSPAQRRGMAEEPSSYELDPMSKQKTLELVRAYYQIPNPKVRKRLFEVTKAIGAAFENKDA
jgi:hypothetical protein